MNLRRTITSACALATLAMAALPAGASAATISQSGGTVSIVAGTGETNRMVSFYSTTDTAAVVEDSVPVSVGPGCTVDPDDVRQAICPVQSPNFSIAAQLGDGSDYASLSARTGSVNTIDGGPGNDEIRGDSGSGAVNSISGGDGDDLILPDYGFERNPVSRDAIAGGGGEDTVRYYFHATGVNVSLDGQANDGSPGEGDNVQPDVERLLGSDLLPNTLTGTDGPDELVGGTDKDVLVGGGGNDELIGVSDNDDLSGGEGDDLLIGGTEDDRLDGGGGFDSFVGDETGSPDQAITGNDTVLAQDGVGKEPISCGPGSDTVTADRDDVVATDPFNACEDVTLGGGSGGGLPGVDVGGPKSAKVGSKLSIKTVVSATDAEVVAKASGVVTLGSSKARYAPKIKLTTVKKTVAAGESATLVQRLAGSKGKVAKAQKAIAKALKKGGKAKAKVSVKLEGAGASGTVKRTVQIK